MAARIYLDHSATTPIRAEVFAAMEPWLCGVPANAGSVHSHGRAALAAIENARDHVAALIGAPPKSILFTSGGTEANNAAIFGLLEAQAPGRRQVVASAIEHHAVLHACERAAERFGSSFTILPVDAAGIVDVSVLDKLEPEGIGLVSVMHANNETGVIQPIEAVAEWCAARDIPLHTDAVQTAGKMRIDAGRLGVSALSLSGHKLYGPQGAGALYLCRGTAFEPQQVGGAQERGRRAGTENVAAIVGFGEACRLAGQELDDASERMRQLRDAFEASVLGRTQDAYVNGAGAPRLPHVSNIRFEGVEGESLLQALDMNGVSVSTGSACTSGSLEPSHVILAMGVEAGRARGSIRFSLGKDTTAEEMSQATNLVPQLAERIKSVESAVSSR